MQEILKRMLILIWQQRTSTKFGSNPFLSSRPTGKWLKLSTCFSCWCWCVWNTFYITCSVLPALAVGLCRLVSRNPTRQNQFFSDWLIVWNKSVWTCLRQVWADIVLKLCCPWCMLMISFHCSWQSAWINSVISLILNAKRTSVNKCKTEQGPWESNKYCAYI